MRYGIANIKGGSGGTTIPTLTITQSQLGGGGFTPTQEQISIMQNNDIIIFDCAYIGKKLVMQKVRWDGIFSQNALTPQTTIVFTSNFNSPDFDNKYIAGLQIALPENSNVCYMNTTDILIPEASQSVCFTSASPSSDSDGDYFDYEDIDGDLGSYSVIVQTDASGNALKVYTIDWIDYENAYLYVSEKAKFSVGTYKHNIVWKNSTGTNETAITLLLETNDNTPLTTNSDIASVLYNKGFTTSNNLKSASGCICNKSNSRQYIIVGFWATNSSTLQLVHMQQGILTTDDTPIGTITDTIE